MKRKGLINVALAAVSAGLAYALLPGNEAGALAAITSVLGNVSINIASQFSFDSFSPWIREKWLENPNPVINHHINRSMVSAWEQTLNDLIGKYLSDQTGIEEHERLSLVNLKNDLNSISVNEFLIRLNEDADHDEIFQYAGTNENAIYQNLNRRFRLNEILDDRSETYYLTTHFIQYFIGKLPGTFAFNFRADLKKGEEAKEAMDLLYFETLRQAILSLSDKNTVQEELINKVVDAAHQLPVTFLFEAERIQAAMESLNRQVLLEIQAVTKKIQRLSPDPVINDFKERIYKSKLLFKSEYISFVGRENELNQLEDFTRSDSRFEWWMITGPGGAGKSKLALHFCQHFPLQGWNAGFISTSELMSFEWNKWQPKSNYFIVLDYAGLQFEQVIAQLAYLASVSRKYEFNIRFLLLERKSVFADGNGTEIPSPSFQSANLQLLNEWELGFTSAVLIETLPSSWRPWLSLNKLGDRQIWQIFLHVFAKEKKAALDQLETLALFHRIDKHGRPLFAIHLALSLCQKISYELNSESLLESVMTREENKVWKVSCTDSVQLRRHKALVAISTICGGLTEPDLRQLYNSPISRWIPRLEDIDDALYLTITQNRLYEGDILYPPMEPDVLGEFFVVRYIENSNENNYLTHQSKVSDVINFCWSHKTDQSSHFVVRLLQDFQIDKNSLRQLVPLMNNLDTPVISPWAKAIIISCCSRIKKGEMAEAAYWMNLYLANFGTRPEKEAVQSTIETYDYFIRELLNSKEHLQLAYELWEKFKQLDLSDKDMFHKGNFQILGSFHRHFARYPDREMLIYFLKLLKEAVIGKPTSENAKTMAIHYYNTVNSLNELRDYSAAIEFFDELEDLRKGVSDVAVDIYYFRALSSMIAVQEIINDTKKVEDYFKRAFELKGVEFNSTILESLELILYRMIKQYTKYFRHNLVQTVFSLYCEMLYNWCTDKKELFYKFRAQFIIGSLYLDKKQLFHAKQAIEALDNELGENKAQLPNFLNIQIRNLMYFVRLHCYSKNITDARRCFEEMKKKLPEDAGPYLLESLAYSAGQLSNYYYTHGNFRMASAHHQWIKTTALRYLLPELLQVYASALMYRYYYLYEKKPFSEVSKLYYEIAELYNYQQTGISEIFSRMLGMMSFHYLNKGDTETASLYIEKQWNIYLIPENYLLEKVICITLSTMAIYYFNGNNPEAARKYSIRLFELKNYDRESVIETCKANVLYAEGINLLKTDHYAGVKYIETVLIPAYVLHSYPSTAELVRDAIIEIYDSKMPLNSQICTDDQDQIFIDILDRIIVEHRDTSDLKDNLHRFIRLKDLLIDMKN